jgi:hypothetical protein
VIFPGSRYQYSGTTLVEQPGGASVPSLKIPRPRPAVVQGFVRRQSGQRLDLIAHHYLNDPTGFWRLCDANNAMAPDALANSALVGIPLPGN